MDSMDELRSPSRPTSPAASIIILPLPSTLFVLQLLGTIRCPEKPRAAQGLLQRCLMLSRLQANGLSGFPLAEGMSRTGEPRCRAKLEGAPLISSSLVSAH